MWEGDTQTTPDITYTDITYIMYVRALYPPPIGLGSWRTCLSMQRSLPGKREGEGALWTFRWHYEAFPPNTSRALGLSDSRIRAAFENFGF